MCAAAPASPELFQYYNALGLPLREGYGQTESTGVIAVQRIDRPRWGFVGEPLPGVEVKIAEDGEILAKGANVFKGYFKDPELTDQTIKNGWLHTGDVGQMEDGHLKILDRKKDILITAGGKNITPSEIENQLKFSPYITDAVVVGDKRPFLTCLVMIDHENVTKFAQDNDVPFTNYTSLCHATEVEDLVWQEIESVNAKFARVETIKKFRLIDQLLDPEDDELTPTQKLKRKVVNEKYADLIASMY